ncbi:MULTISPECIES: response regulator [Pseudoalteromonas]|uniref:Response regulator containing CheY-like receiver, AAA-type ATPase, and DNA-binding domain protein n=1 Tax=Pseudoalteromonas luteoviolacea (strain 2ta16) TaxID=1353533 RepID=V4HYW6_PSEL2|nr:MULTISPECIES: response regulator [Pseudoalteromonas]ESP94983.1 response regulator containing CheY-like receiver, AAA-type ATPase, and DNA-binding domain protein [Pseudoalteromonas luteoviolacea 2ta16]KZN36314.1 hypothetical protein N483_22650 [Pseudoalteromonas luteoviolacea NCIMB 1944]MCG7550131.1 response regulator [Pseudoalteromonas sp. Of7M-16]
MRLLWIDDEKDNFFFETMLLEEEGFTLDWATTIPEAAKLLNQHYYDGILLDQQIKDISQPIDSDLVVWMGTLFICWLKNRRVHLDQQLLELLEKLKTCPVPKESNTTTPILIISGFYDSDVQKTINQLCDGRIKRTTKPLEEAELLNFTRSLEIGKHHD